MTTLRLLSLLAVTFSLLAAGCGSDDPETDTPFELAFAATNGGAPVDCETTVTGVGPDGDHAIGLADLRFYVSNVRLFDADGAELAVALDDNAFQYTSDEGALTLIDLTGNDSGTCAASAIAFAEGTARVNDRVAGRTEAAAIARVAFDVGVPQAVMKKVIAANTPEGAPSPLNEMYWSWASGYRHFVFNFAVEAPASDDPEADTTGDGYVHVGSRACGAEGTRALEDREACDFIYTPTVELAAFDPATDVVAVDLGTIIAGLDFVAPIYDPETFEVIGEGPGVECHSAPALQPDCTNIFDSFGLDVDTGSAEAARNAVFRAAE